MYKQKEFFIRMCEMENLTAQELQKITNKSKSVVYEWLNYSNVNSFPSYDCLSKIVCRLGVSIDDLLKCKSDKLIDYMNYRRYSLYITGSIFQPQISEEILENPEYINILGCYVNDCNILRVMLNNYLSDSRIDVDELDILCEHIKPLFVSDVEYALDDFGGGAFYHLNSKNIEDFKNRTELFNDRVENDEGYALSCKHQVYFPNINKILLKIAEENIDLLKKHLLFLDEYERTMLMKDYLEIATIKSDYDKNLIIFKLLYSNKYPIENIFDQELLRKYNENQEKVENGRDKLFVKIAKYVVSLTNISTIELQKEFNISFSVASEMIKRLENKNVISSLSISSPRKVLMSITDLIDNKII